MAILSSFGITVFLKKANTVPLQNKSKSIEFLKN